MRRVLLLGILCAGVPAIAQEFKCPEGTRDSGSVPGQIIRWCETQDGRLLYHGPLWKWHRNGQIHSRMTFVYGSAEGEEQEFHENGKPASRGVYVKSRRIGPWQFWDEAGGIETEVVYASDGRNKRTNYYPSGRKLAEGTFTATGKIGAWTYWSDDGKEKARCDFGEGLFALTSDACRVIAKEVEPEGFSPPIPKAATTKGGAALSLAHENYQFAVPAGWVADVEAGKGERVPLVFYAPGSSWRGPSWNAYVRPLFKEGAAFNDVVARVGRGIAENAPEYAEQPLRPGALADSRATVTRTISYRAVQRTSGQFAVVGDGRVHETITFIDASPNVVLMLVVTAPSEKLAADAAVSATALAASLRGP